MHLHPITPGLWCVPAALTALTGADPISVIQPALNRHGGARTLTGLVVGSTIDAALKTLVELNYTARRYKQPDVRARVSSWAKRSQNKYPNRALLVHIPRHVMVIQDGRVYDTWTPHGAFDHPLAGSVVDAVYLVEQS